jgi:hypothetical protein
VHNTWEESTTAMLLNNARPSTNSYPDVKAVVGIIKLAKLEGHESEAMAELIELRKTWKSWQFITQRKWQTYTRRQSKARHHDSIEIRERYVRIS